MARIIKEMAMEKYDFRKSTNPKNRPLVMKGFFAYQAGAKAVINEVEMLLNSQRFVDNPSQELLNLLKQLKGD